MHEGVGQLVRRVALAADQAVVMGTPVDTSRARSNWVVEIGRRASGTRAPYSPGDKGSTGGASAAAAIQQGQGVIASYDIDRDNSIHITNNLDYIERLNDGYSAQAPAGYVQDAIALAVRVIRSFRIIR